MGNTYGLNVWNLDTQGTDITDKVRVQRIEWYPAAVDNDLLIEESSTGEDIMRCRAKIASGANMEEIGTIVRNYGGRGRDFQGLKLTTLDGGVVRVFLV